MRRQRDDDETNTVSSQPVSMYLRVCEIKCAQSSVRRYFTDGQPVGALIQDLRARRVVPIDLNIRVYYHEGSWYALDHRRAWAVVTACSPNFRFRVLNDQNPAEFNRKFTGYPEGLWPQWQDSPTPSPTPPPSPPQQGMYYYDNNTYNNGYDDDSDDDDYY